MVEQVREVMTEAPVAVGMQEPAVAVARQMRDEDIGAVLVTEDDRLRGLVTDRDIVVRLVAEGADPNSRSIGDVCSSELVSISPDEHVDQAVQLMRDHAVRRLPVVAEGHTVGIVSLGDLAVEREPESALGDISAADPNR
jgi:CBS domain-containing protein